MHPDGWQRSPSPYSYAIRTGDTLFLSGFVSRNGRDNTVVPGDVPAQTRVVLDNAGELLRAAGMTHANVVSARVYLPDGTTFQQMNGEYPEVLATEPPARATVQARLPDRITTLRSHSSRRLRPVPSSSPGRPETRISAALSWPAGACILGHAGESARQRRRREEPDTRRWRRSGARSRPPAPLRTTSWTASST